VIKTYCLIGQLQVTYIHCLCKLEKLTCSTSEQYYEPLLSNFRQCQLRFGASSSMFYARNALAGGRSAAGRSWIEISRYWRQQRLQYHGRRIKQALSSTLEPLRRTTPSLPVLSCCARQGSYQGYRGALQLCQARQLQTESRPRADTGSGNGRAEKDNQASTSKSNTDLLQAYKKSRMFKMISHISILVYFLQSLF
jgi:hypothetical protein